MAFTPEQITEILQIYFDNFVSQTYTGMRYVPIIGRRGESSAAWDNTAPYEPLTIVTYNDESYTSRQFVPAEVDISNTDYWVKTGAYNAFIAQLQDALPIAQFDSENTVKDYIDELGSFLPASDFDNDNTVKAYIDEVADLLPSSAFDSVNTVRGAINEVKDVLPFSSFDNVNTVKAYIDNVDTTLDTKIDNFISSNSMYSLEYNGIYIGHQGSFSTAPGNTIPAFLDCGKYGIDAIETDIWITSDNKFVCCHDSTIDATTNGTGTIASMTLSQIRNYDIDTGNYISEYANLKIPTLEEYLTCCVSTGCIPFIEIKSVGDYSNLATVVDIVNNYNLLSKSVFISADAGVIYALYELNPSIKTLLITSSAVDASMITTLQNCHANGIDLDVGQVTESACNLLRSYGFYIAVWYTWTYSHPFNNWAKWGVNAITINNPFATENYNSTYSIIDNLYGAKGDFANIPFKNPFIPEFISSKNGLMLGYKQATDDAFNYTMSHVSRSFPRENCWNIIKYSTSYNQTYWNNRACRIYEKNGSKKYDAGYTSAIDFFSPYMTNSNGLVTDILFNTTSATLLDPKEYDKFTNVFNIEKLPFMMAVYGATYETKTISYYRLSYMIPLEYNPVVIYCHSDFMVGFYGYNNDHTQWTAGSMPWTALDPNTGTTYLDQAFGTPPKFAALMFKKADDSMITQLDMQHFFDSIRIDIQY